jgi:hypothetical protein
VLDHARLAVGGVPDLQPVCVGISVWPGDTFGISTLSPTNVLPSWGGRVNGKQSEIFAASVTASLP